MADQFQEARHQPLHINCRRQFLVAHFVHIESSIDFYLQGMAAKTRLAVALGGETARIRLIPQNPQPLASKPTLRGIDQAWRASLAMVVPQDDVDPLVAVTNANARGRGWHRMGIDQKGRAKEAVSLLDQTRQGSVVGPPAGLKPTLDFVGWNTATIDGLAACGHAWDHAQARCHTRRPMVERTWQGPFKHPRIELIGLAIGVDIGAWETSRKQWNAQGGRGGEQLVHEGVFRPAQCSKRNGGDFQEIRGIEVATVGGRDDHR